MKKILVTGGTRGIGAAISIELQKLGYEVTATFVSNKSKANAFAKSRCIRVEQVDVSDYEACAELAKKIGPVYGIVHNAGITQDSFFHKMDPEQWHSIINTNLTSCFNVIRPFIEGMRADNQGRIVVISSINGLKGQMGQTNYCAAKAGVIGFVKALALESANKKITVNAVAPGYIETDMVKAIDPEITEKIKAQIPVGRLGHVDEIAKAVAYLVSEDAGFMTGETININGGQYMS